MSLYPLLRGLVEADKPLFPGVTRVINYGLDKLRFPNAVRAGSRVRARCVLLKLEAVTGGLQLTEQYTVEIEGEAKPACVAEAIMRRVLRDVLGIPIPARHESHGPGWL